MKNIRTIFLFPIISAALIWGCRQEKSASSPPLRLVAEVIAGDVPVTMSFVGQTYGRNDITIQARVDGFLRSIHFKEGSFVRKGELLYVMSLSLTRRKRPATAAVRQAEAEMIARQNYDRVRPLAETDAASKSDLDQAVARLSAARASLNAAQAALDYTRIEQGYTRISSPVDGIVGRTLARVGDYVGQGSQYTVLNTVSQVDSIRVLFYIPEQTYYDMLSRDRARLYDITLRIAGNVIYPQKGRFDFIGRAVQQQTGSLDAQVTFPNPDTLLRPGQFARIEVVADTVYGALLVPQTAVVQTQNVYSVNALDRTTARGSGSSRSETRTATGGSSPPE
ncbi:MAG: efflux RND transporter periplasmic adaptor subunit [Alistipes sp.]